MAICNIATRYLGLHDTCGVNNLHGMPSLLGAASACIIAAWAKADTYGDDISIYVARDPAKNGTRTSEYQAQMQVAFLFITVGISMVSGLFVGWFATHEFFDPMQDGHLFLDEESWEVPHLETPYYFDHRGEIGRNSAPPPAAASADKSAAAVAVNVHRPASPKAGEGDNNMDRIASVLQSLQQEIASSRKRN